MKFFPFLFILILLQSCGDAFTSKRAVTKEEFYKLKDNVTITKVTEGQILENATPKAQQIYQKIANKKQEAIDFLNTHQDNQNQLYQILELDSSEINFIEQIAYYKESAKIKFKEEKLIFEAYQNIEDTTFYQENLQLLHGKEKILYNYPNFDSDKNKFDGMWSILLKQKSIIRSLNK